MCLRDPSNLLYKKREPKLNPLALLPLFSSQQLNSSSEPQKQLNDTPSAMSTLSNCTWSSELSSSGVCTGQKTALGVVCFSVEMILSMPSGAPWSWDKINSVIYYFLIAA